VRVEAIMSQPNGAPDVTALLRAWNAGSEGAYGQLATILYDELKRQAAHCMRRQRPGDTLQTTLVHEAFVRLTGAGQVDWQDRNHFLAVAARTMRRVLVDMARAEATAKRGARADHVPLDSDLAAEMPSLVDLIAVDAALATLAALDPRKVKVVELRFFAGLTVEETAAILDIAPDTVARDWRMARTWLLRELDTRPA
jgi:RNA polymerase sigma factor (TIGR02999 family)